MESFLTQQQVVEYKKLHKQCKSMREGDRIKAILLLNRGFSYQQTAEILLMDEDSIRRWYQEYETGGIKNLLQDRYKGGEAKLSMEAQKELAEYLEDHICLSANQVCHYVQQRYAQHYTIKGMTDLLHRLGFTYKNPSIFRAKPTERHRNSS